MRRTWRLAGLLLGFAGIAASIAAQPEAERALQRGILAEQSQGDLGLAVTCYREAVGAAREPELATQAHLHLGLVLGKLGRLEEARAMLVEAGKGTGEAARRAQALLAGDAAPRGDDRARARIDRAILHLQTGDDTEVAQATTELVWLGGAAAETLAEAVSRHALDVRFAGRATRVLAELGGEPLLRLVRAVAAANDEVLAHTVTASIGDWYASRPRDAGEEFPRGSDALRAAIDPFLAHPAPRLRQAAHVALWPILDDERITRGLDDAEVRDALWTALERLADGRLQLDRHDDGGRPLQPERRFQAFLRFALPRAERALERGEPARHLSWLYRRVAHHGVRTAEEWRFLLACLADEEFPEDELAPPYPRQGPEDRRPAPSAAELVPIARHVLAIRERRNTDRRLVVLTQIVEHALPVWTPAEVPAHIELLSIGLPPSRGQMNWLMQSARPVDDRALLQLLATTAMDDAFLSWIGSRKIDPAAFETLHGLVRDALERPESAPERATRAWTRAFLGMEHSGVPGAVEEWVRTLDPARLGPLVAELVAREETHFAPARAHLLVRRVTLGPPMRNLLFGHCVRAGVTDPEPYLAAYEDELGEVDVEGVRLLGVQWLLRRTSRSDAPCDLGMAEEQAAILLERCLVERPRALLDALRCVPVREFGGTRTPCVLGLPDWAEALLLRHAARIPWDLATETSYPYEQHVYRLIERTAERAAGELAVPFLAGCLSSRGDFRDRALRALASAPFPALVPQLVALLDDEASAAGAFRALQAHDEVPEAARALASCLEHRDPKLRTRAIAHLTERDPERAPDRVRPLLADPTPDVRRSAARNLGHLLDKTSVPQLVAALRDPEETVRNEARTALDAIASYHEQKARWERWLRGADLGTNSAAEALIQQARSGATLEIRLAAIRSLGVLAVAETLPVLIEWMGADDPQIAAAAREAVTAIHEHAKR